MNSKRLIWADSLKGILIVFVVLGHSIQYTIGNACYTNHLWNFIYSFHMAAFMAISGYLAYRSESGGGYFVWKIIVRRFRQLVVPFFLWTFISVLASGQVNFSTIVVYLLYPDKGLWFLWVLFFINIVFFAGCWLADRIKCKIEPVILGISLLLVVTMVLFEVRVFSFQFIAYYFMFYTIGYFFHKYGLNKYYIKSWLLVLLSACWAVLAWFWQMHELPVFLKTIPMPSSIMQYVYRFVTATIAVCLLLNLAPRLLDSEKKWNVPFVGLGKISLGIYAVHFMMLSWLIPLLLRLDLGEEMMIICTFVTVMPLTWCIVWMLRKTTFTAKYFLGKI